MATKRFEVSVITVRRAMQNLEESQIVKREQGRGTFVISDIKRSIDNGTVALLNVIKEDKNYSYASTPTLLLEKSLQRRGYRLRNMNVVRS
ncbi:MAG: GntR family transcriptional regulator, partial [Bacteroides sp.]|nr:GntR family transcriptional regulator [Bacteroides sp.]